MKTSRIEKSLINIDEIIKEIDKKSKVKLKDLDENQSALVKEISKRTIDVLKQTKIMIKDVFNKTSDEDELNGFLDRVDSKCYETRSYCLKKLDEIKPIMDAKYKTNKNTMEGFLDNENIKNAVGLINVAKDAIVDFFDKPETKKTIDKVKYKILDEADKGLDKVLRALDKEKKNR